MESHAVDAFVAMVMKLSETTFKPLFLKLVSWHLSDAQRMGARRLLFFRLVDNLMGSLRNIFGVCSGLC